MKQPAVSMRPGTILGYKGDPYRVISNDTLVRRFSATNLNTKAIKTFRYSPGQEIDIRWKPEERR